MLIDRILYSNSYRKSIAKRNNSNQPQSNPCFEFLQNWPRKKQHFFFKFVMFKWFSKISQYYSHSNIQNNFLLILCSPDRKYQCGEWNKTPTIKHQTAKLDMTGQSLNAWQTTHLLIEVMADTSPNNTNNKITSKTNRLPKLSFSNLRRGRQISSSFPSISSQMCKTVTFKCNKALIKQPLGVNN